MQISYPLMKVIARVPLVKANEVIGLPSYTLNEPDPR